MFYGSDSVEESQFQSPGIVAMVVSRRELEREVFQVGYLEMLQGLYVWCLLLGG